MLFVFENEEVRYFPHSYSDYWEQQQNPAPKTSNTPNSPNRSEPVSKSDRKKEKSQKLSWKEERELEQLETQIETLQERLGTLESELANSGNLDAGALQRLSNTYGECQDTLSQSEERWLELEEKKEALSSV